jgi:hypothetical protein
MVFKVETKNLHVYDPKSESFIAGFVDGRFETEDITLSERLIELGYKPEAVEFIVKDVTEESIIVEPVSEKQVEEIIEKPKKSKKK